MTGILYVSGFEKSSEKNTDFIQTRRHLKNAECEAYKKENTLCQLHYIRK